MAIASDALAAVGDVTMVCEAKLVYIMIVVDVRFHFVVSNFENGHSSIGRSMIYVIFSRIRAFSRHWRQEVLFLLLEWSHVHNGSLSRCFSCGE